MVTAHAARITPGMIDAINVFTGTNSVVGAHLQAFSALLAKRINETYLGFF
jgi:hypothetical protein